MPRKMDITVNNPPPRLSARVSVLFWADVLVGYALFVMQDYLTSVWNLSFTHAAGILNVWGGLTMILPAICLYLVDVLLGNFGMLVVSSISYSVGIGFVTMSTPPVLGGSCKRYEEDCIGHTQKALFYAGMALIAVGMAGNQVSLKPFLDERAKEAGKDDQTGCCMILLTFSLLVVVALTGAIGLPYVKPWKLRFGIPAICTTVATLIFLFGICVDRIKRSKWPEGPKGESPITDVLRVFLAFWSKLCISLPKNENGWYKKSVGERRTKTRCLGCLEKAAVKTAEDFDNGNIRRWSLSSVGEVEDAKIAVRMVPMWLTFVVCGIISSIGNTYFVEQANNLDRHIGKWNVPLQAFKLLSSFSGVIYPIISSLLIGQETRHKATKGISVAMMLSVLCCITAAKIEHKRLGVVRSHSLVDKPDEDVPMSIYWLVFQFVLLAGLDSFIEENVKLFYEKEAPASMERYFEYFAKFVSGLGYMLSVLTVYVVGKVSERKAGTNWFQPSLNESRLDKYYWVLSALGAVNLAVFLVVAVTYRYKSSETSGGGGGGEEAGDGGGPPETGGDADGGDGGKCCCCCS